MFDVDAMVKAAQGRAEEFAAPDLSPEPRRKIAVLACMDARIDPYRMLGLERGDANIIRNAGGLVTDDVLRSLTISQHLLGTEEIIVMMHDDCGLQGSSEEDLAAAIAENGKSTEGRRLGAFDDVERTLSGSLARLRSAPTLRTDRSVVRGVVFDPRTGRLREVSPPPDEDAADHESPSGRSS
jgi:carbonic anhydrase